MSTFFALIIQAIIAIAKSLLNETLFEEVLRRATIHLLYKIVKSTKNTVDDDIVQPIIERLDKKNTL